ncbi:hypothetical protein V5F29_10925 [Xanthobacter aminoxidans]|uniref:hypothetical protein n=1 Tax=Xanthobacter aminoxidans TaxID=186280 RepID=UPI003727B1F6
MVGAAAIAHFVGGSAWKIRQLHQAGKIPVVRLGKNGPLMARKVTLLRWIEQEEKRACDNSAS